jgi:hypothetical protein
LHAKQFRKGKTPVPYIVHPVSVAMILSEFTEDENLIAAALLHDVLEDVKGYGKARMMEDFGPAVTGIVEEVSDGNNPEVDEDKSKTWYVRKDRYLNNLEKDSAEALMICAADKIDNLLSMRDLYLDEGGKEADAQFHAPLKDRMKFMQDIIQILHKRLPGQLTYKLVEVFKDVRMDLGMLAHPSRLMDLSEDYKNVELECPVCGWKGNSKDELEATDCVMQVECPVCEKMLLVAGALSGE